MPITLAIGYTINNDMCFLHLFKKNLKIFFDNKQKQV